MAQRGGRGVVESAVEIDPVCGAPVSPAAEGAVVLRHAGRSYRFCSQACRGRFAREAERAALGEALVAGRLLSHRARPRWGLA